MDIDVEDNESERGDAEIGGRKKGKRKLLWFLLEDFLEARAMAAPLFLWRAT